jgi:pantoate--beta-alanine ligase
MQIIATNSDLYRAIQSIRQQGQTIGFVPTMGYLHDGHLSLIRRARKENDAVVVSVFVNPAQFGPNEDLEAYPRDHQRDLALLEKEKIAIAFFPTVEELYPPGYSTYIDVEGDLTSNLCGRSRPGHFRGVATIVAKLFHLTAPTNAYFGQKDAQQVAVINRMVKDLDLPVTIVACPTVRESDGLAMSSRNTYLTEDQRRAAPEIYQALKTAAAMIDGGERNVFNVMGSIRRQIGSIEDSQIDYVAIVNADTLSPLEAVEGPVLIAVAVKIGATRLIDNIQLQV